MITVREFADNFMALVGDTTESTPEQFIINGINWCFRELPLEPGLGKLFTKHYKVNLDAKHHYKWLLNGDFRTIGQIPMLNFYSSTGGDPCKLTVCYKPVEDFYNLNGLVELKVPGIPCQYTLEPENDDLYLVLDRPSDVPIILDYIVYGFPKPVSSMNDKMELSAIAEHLMTMVLQTVWLRELDDYAFSGAIGDYLDNKYVPEAIQMLNKTWKAGTPVVLGEN